MSNVLKLSDGFLYVVTNQIELNGKKYCQMIRIDEDSDFVLAEKIDNEYILIEEENLKLTLLKSFADSMLNCKK